MGASISVTVCRTSRLFALRLPPQVWRPLTLNRPPLRPNAFWVSICSVTVGDSDWLRALLRAAGQIAERFDVLGSAECQSILPERGPEAPQCRQAGSGPAKEGSGTKRAGRGGRRGASLSGLTERAQSPWNRRRRARPSRRPPPCRVSVSRAHERPRRQRRGQCDRGGSARSFPAPR